MTTREHLGTTPSAGWARARDYFALTKPKVVSLIMFTAIAGMFLAVPGFPPADSLIWGTLGIALAASSAAAINHVLDARIDAEMARTRARPLPRGTVSEAYALSFAARRLVVEAARQLEGRLVQRLVAQREPRLRREQLGSRV